MAVFRGQGHLGRALEACLAARQQLRALAFRGGEQSPYAHGVCIGLDSGELLSGSIGARALGRLDYTVLGDVVNTAAWLASVAGKDQILIRESLGTRLDTSFECVPHGARQVPGQATLARVHEVVSRREAVLTAADSTASAAAAPRRERSQRPRRTSTAWPRSRPGTRAETSRPLPPHPAMTFGSASHRPRRTHAAHHEPGPCSDAQC